MNKKWFWLIPVLVLSFALFPQSHSWEDEGGYEHPFPGLWTQKEEFNDEDLVNGVQTSIIDMTIASFTYRGQLVSFDSWRWCYGNVESEGYPSGCENGLTVELGWQPQTHEQTVVLFLAAWGKGNDVVEWHFSPAYGDNPERDGPFGLYYTSQDFTDQVDGEWRWYRIRRLFLTGTIAESREGCEEIYYLRSLEDGKSRLAAGCPVYASEQGL